MANGGTATLTDCTISGNSAVAAISYYPYAGQGGGLSSARRRLTSAQSARLHHRVENYPGPGKGGGIFNQGAGQLRGAGRRSSPARSRGNSARGRRRRPVQLYVPGLRRLLRR